MRWDKVIIKTYKNANYISLQYMWRQSITQSQKPHHQKADDALAKKFVKIKTSDLESNNNDK